MKNFYVLLLIVIVSVANAQVPTASFALSQSSVCPNVTLQVNDQSSGGATTFTYVVDGSTSLTVANPVVSFTADGIHYIEQYAQNSSGVSAPYGQTVMVYPTPVVATGSVGSVKLYPPNGATNGWLPLVYTFNDPLPAGAILSGITITFTGVDQGWGGTGDPAIFYLAGKQVGYGIFLHTANNYTITKMAPFPAYNYGGNNNLEMYFTGYPGWQGFFTNGDVTLHYHTVIPPATYCGGTSIVLNGIGASTYTWLPAAPNGIPFMPLTSNIYTVSGTSTLGCAGTMTQQVNISTPLVQAASGAICPGGSFVITPTGASSYTVSGGNFTVFPNANSSYSVSGTDTLGCVSLTPAIINVTVVPLPVLSVNSGTACIGASYTLQASGASTYTYQGGNPVLTITSSSNYSVNGSNSLGCPALLPAIASITAVALPTVSASNAMVCTGTSHTIQPTGAVSYTFSSGSAVVSPATTSTYIVSGSNASGCKSETVITVVVDLCTSIEDEQTTGFDIFPQPAGTAVSVIAGAAGIFTVRDLNGKQLVNGKIDAGINTIAVGDLSAGIYLITICSGSVTTNRRLVISR